jgi:hypothetical protein
VIKKEKIVSILDQRPSPFLRLNGAREVRLALTVADGRSRNGQWWWLCLGQICRGDSVGSLAVLMVGGSRLSNLGFGQRGGWEQISEEV